MHELEGGFECVVIRDWILEDVVPYHCELMDLRGEDCAETD